MFDDSISTFFVHIDHAHHGNAFDGEQSGCKGQPANRSELLSSACCGSSCKLAQLLRRLKSPAHSDGAPPAARGQ